MAAGLFYGISNPRRSYGLGFIVDGPLGFPGSMGNLITQKNFVSEDRLVLVPIMFSSLEIGHISVMLTFPLLLVAGKGGIMWEEVVAGLVLWVAASVMDSGMRMRRISKPETQD
jgi:hypothetical protein